jgi:hypothetical protein
LGTVQGVNEKKVPETNPNKNLAVRTPETITTTTQGWR